MIFFLVLVISFFSTFYRKSDPIVRMTYKQLLEKLQTIPTERLNDTVTTWNVWNNEFIPVATLAVNKQGGGIDTDVLDYGHYVLELKN